MSADSRPASASGSRLPASASKPLGFVLPQSITSCSPAQFVLAGTTVTPQPPFTVTLTDETPPPGASQPNGVVDATGIYGHRVTDVIRLKIDIKDATGQTPAYPVLVHLNVGGPGHGTLTLDPDGNRVTCTSASFLWHEMNAQGQVVAPNEEFEYKMGTFAPYAGAIPDPQNPGALKPVWAVGEALEVEADAFDANGVEQGYLNDVGVHVEPGDPNHFEWNSKDAVPPANEFHLWAGWGEAGIYEADAYFLDDQYGNHVWGFSNVSLTRQGGNPVNGSVYLADPSNPGGLTGDDSDYHLEFDTGSQAAFAAGTTTFTLTASASTGTVTQIFEFVVDGGTTKFVVIEPNQSTNWIYRVPLLPPPPYDSIDICQPGQPRTDWTGSYVVEDQFGVFQGDHWPAHCGLDGSGSCDPGVSNLTSPDQFRLTLVDASFQTATDGVFEVAFPPSESVSGVTYGGPWQASTNGTLTITLPGKGYFWVRYPSMPHNPGVYTLLIEPLDTGYNTSTLKGYLSYAGTVVGAEILDENFVPANPILVRQAKRVYVRLIDPTALYTQTDVTLQAFDDQGMELGSGVTVPLTKTPGTHIFIGPVTLFPDGDTVPSAEPVRPLPGGLSTLSVSRFGTPVALSKASVNLKFQIDWVDDQGNAVPEQYTVIEGKDHNYAEKTYLQVTVRNPHKANIQVTSVNTCGFLQELALTDQDPSLVFSGPLNKDGFSALDDDGDNGGDVIYSPNATTPEGQPGFPFQITKGQSDGRDGEGALFVRAVARYRKTKGTANRLSDFYSKLQAAMQCPTTGVTVDPSEPVMVEMWVDQVDYFPLTSSPIRHTNLAGSAKKRIDWIEKEAADLLATPTPGTSEQLAFTAVDDVMTDVTGDDSHRTGEDVQLPRTPGPFPDAQFLIHINPTDWHGFRWSTAAEEPTLLGPLVYGPSGFTFLWDFGAGKRFENVLSHESRHALQYRMIGDPAGGDSEGDGFLTAPVWNGQTVSDGYRLINSRNIRKGGQNPEFDLAPNVGDQLQFRAAIERDALRVQRWTTSLDPIATDLVPSSSTFTITAGATTELTLGTIPIWPSNSSGIMVHATSTGQCELWKIANSPSSDELFSVEAHETYPGSGIWLDGEVKIRILASTTPGQCSITLRMIRPAPLAGPEQEGSPHAVQITVQ